VRRLVPICALAALVLAPAASAKMCVQLSTVPSRPVAGEPLTIRMTTWSIEVVHGQPRRGDRRIRMGPGAHFSVRVTSPAGVERRVIVRRRSDYLLTGRFAFPSAGTWTLAWSAFTPRYAGECAGLTRVRVGGR
jgi:hypothetical protein